jgi:CheY-like chemotaxis protein
VKQAIGVARVLLVDDDPASRLTLQTVLKAGGYSVDSAASAAEAVDKLDQREYELVLSDLGMESPEAGYRVLAHAKSMDYQPATAIITSTYSATQEGKLRRESMLIEAEDVFGLLSQIANLIGRRASKKLERQIRLATTAAALS